MRLAALVVLTLVVAGCGASKTHRMVSSNGRGDRRAFVLQPAGPIGHWTGLMLSPDGRTWLAQWSGECETQETFFIPARGGKPRPVTGRRGEESTALGWALHNRARILVARAQCGSQFGKPGIYLVDRSGHATFVKAVKPRRGGP